MTTYIKEQDYLRAQIRGNNLAIKHFTQQLEEVFIQEDFIGTADKVFDGYEKIIELIKLDSKEMRKKIKELDADRIKELDADNWDNHQY